jgi:phosphocarrier protein HPr
MISQAAKIINKLGLHARPSAMLVTAAAKYQAEVYFTKSGLRVNGKSILGVMMLAAEAGSELLIECDGPDEQAAMDALLNVISSRFGEPE